MSLNVTNVAVYQVKSVDITLTKRKTHLLYFFDNLVVLNQIVMLTTIIV